MGGRTRPPYPPEFREEALRLLRSGRQPEELGKEIGVTGQTLRNWLNQGEIDAGRREGLSSGEREELLRLRKENHRLRQERDILKKAAAFFAAENTTIR